MKSLILMCVLALGISAQAEEFVCVDKIVAIYAPGPNWANMPNYFPEHIAFIKANYASGIMDSAGPLTDGGNPSGGMSIFNSGNRDEIEKLVKTDPLIANQVATYLLRNWNLCKPQ